MNKPLRNKLIPAGLILAVLLIIAWFWIFSAPNQAPMPQPQNPGDSNTPTPDQNSDAIPAPALPDNSITLTDAEIIHRLCTMTPPIEEFAFPANQFPHKVQSCGEFFAVHPPLASLKPPVTLISKTLTVIGTCDQSKNAKNPLAECAIPCNSANLCKGIVIDTAALGGTGSSGSNEGGPGGGGSDNAAADNANTENAIRTDDSGYCDLIMDPVAYQNCIDQTAPPDEDPPEDDQPQTNEGFEARFVLSTEVSYQKIEIANSEITYTRFIDTDNHCQDWDQEFSCWNPSDLTSEIVALSDPENDAIHSFIQEINFVSLEDTYGGAGPETEFYPQEIYAKIGSVEKTVIYQTFPGNEPMPTEFSAVKNELFQLAANHFS